MYRKDCAFCRYHVIWEIETKISSLRTDIILSGPILTCLYQQLRFLPSLWEMKIKIGPLRIASRTREYTAMSKCGTDHYQCVIGYVSIYFTHTKASTEVGKPLLRNFQAGSSKPAHVPNRREKNRTRNPIESAQTLAPLSLQLETSELVHSDISLVMLHKINCSSKGPCPVTRRGPELHAPY